MREGFLKDSVFFLEKEQKKITDTDTITTQKNRSRSMKKTAKLLTLAVALFAGFGGTAQAEGFKIGADAVTSYVWRGIDLGN